MSRADIKAAGSEWKSGSTLKLHWYDRLTTLSACNRRLPLGGGCAVRSCSSCGAHGSVMVARMLSWRLHDWRRCYGGVTAVCRRCAGGVTSVSPSVCEWGVRVGVRVRARVRVRVRARVGVGQR